MDDRTMVREFAKVAEDLVSLGDVYEQLLRAGVELDHHESDLYAKKTPESERIVRRYGYKSNVTVFRSNVDGAMWYDIPFAYTPFWDKAVSSLSGGRIRTIAKSRAVVGRTSGTVVLYRTDFRYFSNWLAILDAVGVKHGEEAGFEEPEEVTVRISRV